MKRFIKLITFFLLPILLVFICLELLVVLPQNAFNVKAKYIKDHPDIELLILGSSHHQNNINPEFLSIKTANLAYAFQDPQLDSALFFRYITSLKNIKAVLIEIDYHTLEHKNSDNYFRYAWYYRYHNINISNLRLFFKFFMYPSAPTFFNDHFISEKFNVFNNNLNEFGFPKKLTTNEIGYFNEINYNEAEIFKTAAVRFNKKHLSKITIDNYNYNKQKINSIINYCTKNNIKPILVSTPLFKSFRDLKNNKKDAKRKLFIDSLLTNITNLAYLNYEYDNRFLVTDYKDDDHLTPNGATKFTKLLNQKIDSIQNIEPIH